MTTTRDTTPRPGAQRADERGQELTALRAMMLADRYASPAEVERRRARIAELEAGAPAADRGLVALFQEADAIWDEWNGAKIDGPGGHWDALLEAGHAVERRIMNTRPATPAGALLKMRELVRILEVEEYATEWQVGMARSVLADLEGLAAAVRG